MDQLLKDQFKTFKRMQELLKKFLETPCSNSDEVIARKNLITKHYKQFCEKHNSIDKIKNTIDTSNEEYFKQNLLFKCEDLYLDLSKANKLDENQPSSSGGNQRGNKEKNKSPAEELTKRSVKKFSGKTSDWIEFRKEFYMLVISNSDLTDSQKSDYLKSVLPKEIPLSSEIEFNQTWKILDDKFKNLILNEYLTNIIQHRTVSSSEDIFQLLDMTIKYLNELESLNINVHKWDELLIHILITKFIDRVKTEWFGSRSSNESPQLYDFLKFLKSKKFITGLTDEIEKFNYASSSRRRRSYYRCVCCAAKHTLWECEEFKRMDIDAKWAFINKKKVCRFCLNSNHVFGECYNKYVCKYCGQFDHHHLLHRHESSRK